MFRFLALGFCMGGGLLGALLFSPKGGEGFLLLHDLELHGGQVFLGAAAFAALDIRKACGEHVVMELVLQNTVGFAQDDLAAFGAHGGAGSVQHGPGHPLLAVADLHDGLLDGADQRGIFAAFRPENLLFDDGHIDYMEVEGNLSRTIFTFCANTKKAYSVSTLDGRLKNRIGLMYLSIIALQ